MLNVLVQDMRFKRRDLQEATQIDSDIYIILSGRKIDRQTDRQADR